MHAFTQFPLFLLCTACAASTETVYLMWNCSVVPLHSWEPTAYALATLCASLVLVVSPERIVLSGGVMRRTILYDKVTSYQILWTLCLLVVGWRSYQATLTYVCVLQVRHYTQDLLHGYINLPSITTSAINDYIVPDGFDGKAGIIGALTLAQDALEVRVLSALGCCCCWFVSSRPHIIDSLKNT